jgi:hypothetical protein
LDRYAGLVFLISWYLDVIASVTALNPGMIPTSSLGFGRDSFVS